MKKPYRRSTGTAFDYFERIQKGDTLAEIAERYQTTGANVRNALERHGLPTCANAYLKWLNSKEKA